MEDLSRRAFLKLAAAGAATTAGSAMYGIKMADRLVPYVVPPVEARPGSWTAYATTCRECPAGCSMLVRHRDGRATKAEGNPDHPVGRGGLCPRGQSSVQGLYDPDRLRSPRRGPGMAREASWDEAFQVVGDRLRSGARVFVLSDLQTGTLAGVMDRFARAFGGGLLFYEPLSYQPLRAAHAAVLDRPVVPRYDLSGCEVILSFGADFLESWVSNVEFARQFADGRVPADGHPRSRFAYVGPRLSMTAANADDFLLVPPEAAGRVAMAMLGVMLDRGLARGDGGKIASMVQGYDFRAPIPGLGPGGANLVAELAQAFATAGRSVALAGPAGAGGQAAEATATATALLNLAAGRIGQTVDLNHPHALSSAAGTDEARKFLADLTERDILLVHNANPAYALPDWPDLSGRAGLVIHLGTMPDETATLADWVLPIDSPLETWGEYAPYPDIRNLIQPTMARLHDTRNAGDIVLDLAVAGGKSLVPPRQDGTAPPFVDLLAQAWVQAQQTGQGGPAGSPMVSPATSPEGFWRESVRRGGLWAGAGGGAPSTPGASGRTPAPPARPDTGGQGAAPSGPAQPGPGQPGSGQTGPGRSGSAGAGSARPLSGQQDIEESDDEPGTGPGIERPLLLHVASSAPVPGPSDQGSTGRPAGQAPGVPGRIILPGMGHPSSSAGTQGLALWVWPPITLFDGRLANRGWMQEVPEPASWMVWGSWIDLHPDTAARLGLDDGSPAVLAVGSSQMEAQVRVTRDVAPNVAAVPLGQGHTALGRNAVGRGVNPFRLLGPAPASGVFGEVTLRRGKNRLTVVNATSTQEQHGRELLQWVRAEEVGRRRPEEHFSLPLGEGYDPDRDLYRGHVHAGHRWAMVIDLERCIGCGACTTACYAENNIPVIGVDNLSMGRNMSWIRVLPYRHPEEPSRLAWLPLPCQHCDAAPCEPVCPVYASVHNEEGLNAQIYNRCVGTRYCNNNCPYKVRRFNWFDFYKSAFPEPLDWQLNPDVTVRCRGVMEKCTFCVQRIREAEYQARIEGNRMLRDGEIQPACVQSCPARAFAFGDLLDPHSEVSRLTRNDPRRYHVLEDLNTKPAVTYLRRVLRT